uniref:hypothetical protein n=1 Tax=Proteus mirabilis TaxID=584 RepID=UPI000F163AE8
QSLQYTGEVSPAKKVGIWAGGAVVLLLILLFAALFVIQHFSKTTDAALSEEVVDLPIAEPEQVPAPLESIPLPELEEMAKKMDLVLIKEDEYQNLLQNQENTTGALQEIEEQETLQTITITVQHGMKAYEVAKILVESDIAVAQDVEEVLD